MKRSHEAGIGFGITSGVITPLGLMVGLYSGTQSSLIIIGGLLTIAVADAFSDALGIHVSKEANGDYSTKEIWEATISTFFSKLLVSLTFVVPFFFFSVLPAMWISIVWGVLLLGLFSYFIASKRCESGSLAVIEHLGIAALVVVITYLLPIFIKSLAV